MTTQRLYKQLMALSDEDKNSKKAFYWVDQVRDGVTYRIFLYRMCSYTDFLRPGALESRGIMYCIGEHDPILVCRTMPKFFNLHENPITMNLDLTQASHAEMKMDGSLISTYIHAPKDQDVSLCLKSKGALASEQAMAAEEWLFQQASWKLQWELRCIAFAGYTINMEWCAPDNRIVIGYQNAGLTILNVRNNKTGEYLPRDHFTPESEIGKIWTNFVEPEIVTPNWVESIPQMTSGIEGYIVHIGDMWVKIKTEWYLTQHRAKDSINSDRRLYETVLAEATDDLRTLFHDDPIVIQRIEWMEENVEILYNNIVSNVESYYDDNKELERKEYAIKGKSALSKHEFGLAMSKYVGRDVDYKAFMANKWKEFGIKDESENTEV